MSISREDFSSACKELHQRWNHVDDGTSWQHVRTFQGDFTGTWLRITRNLPNRRADSALVSEALEEGVDVDDEDEEALPKRRTPPLVIYDIIHSPSYQVPVLYITFKDLPHAPDGLPSLESVYEMLVPPSHRPQIDAVGVIGALSMTDHPVTSTPACFSHPCRTAEAIEAMGLGKQVRPVDYLLLWLGMVGQGVGFSVPLELAQAVKAENDA